jgi:hypothetical protein
MIDELLARLEVSTVKYGGGRGGISELTPQDIAAALGMCQDRFAASIFQVAAGITFDVVETDKMVAAAQFEEWRNRADRMVNAQLVKAQAAIAPKSERAAAMQHADMVLSGARAAMWPQLVEHVYAAMRKALLAELRASRICHVCNGRGSVQVEGLICECVNCLATGKTAVSNRQRATMLGIAQSSYERTWRPVYEWMYRMLADAVVRGREQFAVAVGRVMQ